MKGSNLLSAVHFLLFGLLAMDYMFVQAKRSMTFSTDQDVSEALIQKSTTMMLISFPRVVDIQWAADVVPYVDLSIEVAGNIKSIRWSHRMQQIDTETAGTRFKLVAQPKMIRGNVFSLWTRYTLRIAFATEQDEGIYEVTLYDPKGDSKYFETYLSIRTGSYTDDLSVEGGKKVRAVDKKLARESRRYLKNYMKDRAKKRRQKKKRRKAKKKSRQNQLKSSSSE